jgi:hypothetical protein
MEREKIIELLNKNNIAFDESMTTEELEHKLKTSFFHCNCK